MLKTNMKNLSIAFVLSSMIIGCGSDSKTNGTKIANGSSSGYSIVYDSTKLVDGKMVGHYHVHAVYSEGKPLSNLNLEFSLINGVKSLSKRKVRYRSGQINASKPITFQDKGIDFSRTSVNIGDTLIVLPTAERSDYTYLGNWTITNVGSVLTLRENAYGLKSTDKLSYIIGNETRLLGGEYGRGTLAVAHIQKPDSDTTTAKTDKNGFTNFDIIFDPTLLAHTVTVGVHTKGGYRQGVSKVIGLRGGKYAAAPVVIANKGGIVEVPMYLTIDPGNGATEYLMDVDVAPTSFRVEPIENCSIDYSKSNFHTDGAGRVKIAVNTDGKIKDAAECTVKWEGSITSIYLEY